MPLTIHIYYQGENGRARRFAEEMTASGIVERYLPDGNTGAIDQEYIRE